MAQIWDSIVQGMAGIIKVFASVGGGNTAIGIILFTISVRLLLLPLTLKSVRSSRAMQQLQPLIKEINKRYETKAGQRLSQEKTAQKQQEVMALYREYSVNPAAGCLPVAIQIPIFFAVYGAVSSVVGKVDPLMSYVQHAWGVFSPDAAALSSQALLANKGILWLNDLSQPDPTYILPILMMLFQFMTTRMSMPRGGGADDQQRRLNSIMQFTPLIFGFTAFQFPVGPVIYWVTTSLFSVVQQFFITGWGSLADLPGLKFLPQKQLKTIELKKRDPNEPRKKTLMERLSEGQERIQSEKQIGSGSSKETVSASADGSVEPDEEKPRNNFGRKAGVGAGGFSSLTPPDVKGISGSENSTDRAKNGSSTSGGKQVQSAYNQLNSRPPKKPVGGSNPPRKTSSSNGTVSGSIGKKKK